MFYLTQLLFYLTPVAAVVFCIVSICRYVSAVRQNKAEPGSVPAEKLDKLKDLLIIFSVFAGIFLLVAVGLIVLLFGAIAYM